VLPAAGKERERESIRFRDKQLLHYLLYYH